MKLRLDPDRTYAIALEGGGARGAYQIGAWRALEEAGIRYNAVSGTSVGALNGAFMAMRDLPRAEKIWKEIRYSHVMDVDDATMRRIIRMDYRNFEEFRSAMKAIRSVLQEGGLDSDPLRQMLEQNLDCDRLRSSGVAFFLTAYDLSDFKALELDAAALTDEQLKDMLMASSNFPAFKQERISGKLYADGGLHDVVPISALLRHGCRDIIVLRLYGLGFEKRVKIPADVTVTTIAPEESLGNMLDFSQAQSNLNMTQGYFDAQRVLYGLYGKTYYLERTCTEEEGYQILAALIRKKHPALSLRALHEEQLSDLGSLLRCKGDYYDLLIAFAERAAQALGLYPYRVRTERELLGEIQAAFLQPVRRRRDKIFSYL